MNVCLSSCGHLYHLQCLQQKDCVWGCASELQRQWRCYKCSAIHGGRVGPSTEPKRGRSTSLAQVCVCDSERRYVSALTQHEMIEVCSKIQQAPS